MANPDIATGEASAERPSDLQELLTMAKQLAEELLKALWTPGGLVKSPCSPQTRCIQFYYHIWGFCQQGSTVEGLHFMCPPSKISLASWDISTIWWWLCLTSSKDVANGTTLFIRVWTCRWYRGLIRIVCFDTVIIPTKVTSLCTVTLDLSSKLFASCLSLVSFSLGSETVMVIVEIIRLGNTISWVGIICDFLQLMVKPNSCINVSCYVSISQLLWKMIRSSRYIISLMPLCLKKASTDFISLVNV